MPWNYVQVDDDADCAGQEDPSIAHEADSASPISLDGIMSIDHAECFLPAVKWFNVEGFSTDDLDFLTEFVRSNAPFIFELAERQKAGPAVA